jgi:putative ABC transport system ATP-binding protein
MGAEASPIVAQRVCHFFGDGVERRQILHDVDLEVEPGEILILTGPSGSGKTTLLTLVGALRSAQQGSLRVLGRELRGAPRRALLEVRRGIGYIFQAHNLLAALSAEENVEMSLALLGLDAAERRLRARAALEAVGLDAHRHQHPNELSGGQRQRVAIARALAPGPRILLADEPTASLDKQSGRDVVDLIRDLARQRGAAVVLVTHDNRILDVADRIVHLEDGRLASFTEACTTATQQMLGALATTTRRGDLGERLAELEPARFGALLEEVTAEYQQFLRVLELSNSAAFESQLDEVLEAFTLKLGSLLDAERATLFLVDAERGELWSKVVQDEREIRVPLGAGIAGRVAATGQAMNVPDAYAEPLFNRAVDDATGYRTRSLLCMPIADAAGRVFAVMQLLNKRDGGAFSADDERLFRDFIARVGVVLEAWSAMQARGVSALGLES